MFRSEGVLVKSALDYDPTWWSAASWNGIPQPGITPAYRWGSYAAIYRRQLWVAVLVNKIANATARLPLKVYRRDDNGRPEAHDHPYARLLRNPSPRLDPYTFWLWTVSTLNIYGEAFWLKQRATGLPVQLDPVHPTRIRHDENGWAYQSDDGSWHSTRRRDLVHFRFYDPDSLTRGMSPLEPLRATLENEDGARTANSALWRNGARPSVVLRHPATLSKEAQQRLSDNWASIHGGAHNFAKTAVLEEGMEAQVISLNADELQYISTRQLNREEACAAYDIPPPVVHILDRATFSNITEQMRSLYRDSMAPKLKLLEATLETELRDGRMGEQDNPDFGEEVYSEFLMDEVLRGAFEARAAAMAQAVGTGQMTPAEARQLENRPFIEGSDQLFINAAVVPIDQVGMAPGGGGDPLVQRHLAGIRNRLSELAGDSKE